MTKHTDQGLKARYFLREFERIAGTSDQGIQHTRQALPTNIQDKWLCRSQSVRHLLSRIHATRLAAVLRFRGLAGVISHQGCWGTGDHHCCSRRPPLCNHSSIRLSFFIFSIPTLSHTVICIVWRYKQHHKTDCSRDMVSFVMLLYSIPLAWIVMFLSNHKMSW